MGFTPWASSALITGLLTNFRQQTTSITPSATINTYGAPVIQVADAGMSGFFPVFISWTTAGVGAETVTLQSTVTYTDLTTSVQTPVSATSSGTANFSGGNIQLMLTGSDARQVKSIAWQVKSSIASSAASATVLVTGINQP
jgi:hypothetical protein